MKVLIGEMLIYRGFQLVKGCKSYSGILFGSPFSLRTKVFMYGNEHRVVRLRTFFAEG